MIDDLNNAQADLPAGGQAGLEDEEAFEASLTFDDSILTLEPVDSADLPHAKAPDAAPAGDGSSRPGGDSAPPEPSTRPRESDTSARRQPPWAGKVLGHFKLLRLLGSGMMGLVVQAVDINLRRVVALKILRKRITGAGERERVDQFLREARAAAQIEHPNVVHIYEINQHEGWWYIAMEMLEGETLKRIVKAAGPLPPARACPPIADAAAALAVAHDLGIIHRDVKPSNLMITRSGRCKLTDFGLVRVDDPNDPFDFTNKTVGTPQFIAPEVILRRQQTPALDVYSLAATLYYALVGSPPYTGKTINDILEQHLKSPPPDVRQHLPDCPVSLARLIQRGMAKDPAERPSAADMAAALRAEAISWRPHEVQAVAPGGSAIITQPPAQAEGSTIQLAPEEVGRDEAVGCWKCLARVVRKWGPRALAAAAAVAIVAAVVLHLLPRRPGRTDRPSGRELARLARRFPGAPETYGVLPPGQVPKPVAPAPATVAPAFSWVGKVDTAGLACVASKRGVHFYRLDDPAAALIRLEDFVGYKTVAEARADGKTPAP